jgi:hypothetical protein
MDEDPFSANGDSSSAWPLAHAESIWKATPAALPAATPAYCFWLLLMMM